MKISRPYIALVVVSAILALILGTKLLISIFFAMVILCILDIAMLKLYKSAIEVLDEDYELNLEVFSTYTLKYKIKNKLPISVNNISIKIDSDAVKEEKKEVMCFKAKELREIQEYIEFCQRGTYNISQMIIQIKSLFGIAKEEFVIYKDKTINVYPKESIIKFDLLGASGYINDRGRKVNYSSEISEIKEYVPGDPVKRINWKHSAKSQKLMVNKYDGEYGGCDYIILDMNKSNYKSDPSGINEEKMVDFAMSLCKSKMTAGKNITMLINNKDMKQIYISKKDDYCDLMEYFRDNKSCGNEKIEDFILKIVKSIQGMGNLTLIINEFNNDIGNFIDTIEINSNIKVMIVCNKVDSNYKNENVKLIDSCS